MATVATDTGHWIDPSDCEAKGETCCEGGGGRSEFELIQRNEMWELLKVANRTTGYPSDPG